MKSIFQLVSLSLIIYITSCAAPVDPITIGLNLSEGDKFVMVTEVSNKGTKDMKYSSTEEAEFEVKAINEEAGKIEMNVHMSRIQSHSEMFGEIETYDSDKAEASMSADEKSMHNDLKSALNSTYSISIGKNGKVIKSFQSISNPNDTEQIVDLSLIFLVFPTHKVGIGDTWENKKTNDLTDQITKTTYEIRKITEEEITISSKAIVSAIPGLLSENIIKGKCLIDRKTGLLIRYEQSMKMQMGGKANFVIYKK